MAVEASLIARLVADDSDYNIYFGGGGSRLFRAQPRCTGQTKSRTGLFTLYFKVFWSLSRSFIMVLVIERKVNIFFISY